jgi:hypothetical protein
VSGRRPRADTGAAPWLMDVFHARCEAKAILVEAGKLELHDAVDRLQTIAEAYGLVRKHGQDCIQQIMSDAFRRRA